MQVGWDDSREEDGSGVQSISPDASLVLTSDDCEMDDDKGGKQKQLPCRASADLHSIPKDSGGWNPQLTHLGIGLRKVSCFSKNSQVLVGEPVWEASPSLSYCLSVLS